MSYWFRLLTKVSVYSTIFTKLQCKRFEFVLLKFCSVLPLLSIVAI